MTADDARKLVQHRFDKLIKNIDVKITEAALKGQYSFEYYIYYDNYDKVKQIDAFKRQIKIANKNNKVINQLNKQNYEREY